MSIHMWRRAMAAVCVLGSVAAAGETRAQVGISTVMIPIAVGQVAGQRGGCHPADAPHFLDRWGPKLDRLMEAYASASDARARNKLFHGWEGGGEWREDGTVRSKDELGAADAGAALSEPTVTRIRAVIGGDLWSARGVWSADAADGKSHYVADFRREKIFGRWYIWRVRRFTPDEAPQLPESFCYLDEVAALW